MRFVIYFVYKVLGDEGGGDVSYITEQETYQKERKVDCQSTCYKTAISPREHSVGSLEDSVESTHDSLGVSLQ